MPKILISLSFLFLTLSAVFGVLNNGKARGLREVAERSSIAQAEADQIRLAKEKEIQAREATLAATAAKSSEAESKVASAEAELIRTQSDKAQIQARLEATQNEIAALRARVEETSGRELLPGTLPMPGGGDLQAQLEDTRRQLDNAEREKQLLADRIRNNGASAPRVEQPRRQAAAAARPNVRGTVLAVNQAYNFVVLNLGGRQGLEPNAEMLVLRGGTLIGKIRVSSVEPATAIGDIISSSLARGVQVQPGDVVIYAGTNS